MTRSIKVTDEKGKDAIMEALRREGDRIDKAWDKIKRYEDSVSTSALGINGFSFSVRYEDST